ncbi:MAG: tetratricopeptide repeat protein, partial [bacterium]
KEKSKEFFTRARRLFEQGLLDDASREVRRALVDSPDYPEAKALLEKIDEGLKRDVASGKTEPFVKRGLEFVMKDRIDEAVAVFKQGLELDPRNEKLNSLIKAAEEKGQKLKGIKPLMDQAQAFLGETKLAEARQVLGQVLEKDPGYAPAYERLAEVLQLQTRQQLAAEIEALAAKADEAFGERRMFDAIAQWNLVRELQSDHARAAGRITEAAAQLRAVGVPGLPPVAQAPWASAVQQSFEKGLTAFMGGQASACLAEWRQSLARIPQAANLLEAFTHKVEDLHAFHVRYHVERAKALWEQGDVGKALAQLRHAIAIDPTSVEARAQFDAHRAAAEQTLQRYLTDAAEWERRDNFIPAAFCLERAFEIDPAREGLKQKVADTRARASKMRELATAMDRKLA